MISSSGTPITITNLIAYNCGIGVMGISSDYSRVKIYNSTLVKTNEYAPIGRTGVRYAMAKNVAVLNFGGLSSHADFLNMDASSSNLACRDTSCTSFTNSFQVTQSMSELFSASSQYDYHINPGSELKNAGTDLSSDPNILISQYPNILSDIDGDTRNTRVSTWDIGADENNEVMIEFGRNINFGRNVEIK